MLIIILMYKNVHFTFNYNIVELEKAFIPNLNDSGDTLMMTVSFL